MMATTHVFAGLAIATAVAAVAPEFAAPVALAAVVGGFFPDLDLYAGHRRTLHFPVYYAVCALVAGLLAIVAPTAVTVSVAVFLLAAAAHSAMDAFGNGLELEPWRGTSSRAVYDHYHGRWIRPRRWVRYDGAPEDFLLGLALAVPALVRFEGSVRSLVIALLTISLVYTVVRKRLVTVAVLLVDRAPAELVDRLPERFLPVEDEPPDRSLSTEPSEPVR